MTERRNRSPLARLASAFLAVSLSAVVLTAPAAAADTDGSDLTSNPGFVVDRGTESSSARTTTGSQIERPAFSYTPCPELTDSVVRLYSAYFLRAPDEGGFDFWITEYSAGNWSLPRMSAFFSQSPEFVEMYGGISDAEFIDLIYLNIFGRAADEGGRNYWLGRMEAEGLDRGTVMLYFSESPEYIVQSQTVRPLAGDFNWYPEGTTWACGFGFAELPIPAEGTYLDLALYNNARRAMPLSVNQRYEGQWENVLSYSLEPGEFFIYFGVPLQPPAIDMVQVGSGSNGDDLIWTVVYSPIPTPRERAGWVPA